MRRADAVFGALLRCYPAAFRDEYGEQMRLMFLDQLRDARTTHDRHLEARLWMRTGFDAFTVAPKEHWHIMLQDLRYTLRTMRARLGFTVVAVLSLALAIGANTAIFSLWNGLLHAPLPGVRAPEELVMLSNPEDSGSWTGGWNGRTDGPRSFLTYEEFKDLQNHAQSFTSLMASQSRFEAWQVRIDGAWEQARGRMVSDNFFDVLGVKPAIGRLFTAGDRTDTSPAVISYRYWQRRFGGRRDVLGSSFNLRQATLTVIGVTPPGFIGETAGQHPDVWLPLHLQPIAWPGRDRLHDTPPDKSMWLHVFGRLKPNVTLAQAEAEANAIFRANLEAFFGPKIDADRRRDIADQRLQIHSAAAGASAVRPVLSNSLTALLVALGVLLLIACVNLANLLLARAAARRSEIAIRLSLGASRARLVRQLVTESLTLTAVGGAAALVVAYIVHGALVRMIVRTDERFAIDFRLEPRVLLFTLAVTTLAGLVVGLLPAWQATQSDAGEALKDQSRGTIGTRRQLRIGRLLVSLQLALSLPLLVGAGLMARTVYNLQSMDLGYRPERLLLLRVDVREATQEPSQQDRLVRDLYRELQRIPGVRTVSFSQLGAFTGGESGSGIQVEGYTPKGDSDKESGVDAVGPGYFAALGASILQGRDILDSDSGQSAAVCVINEAFAKQFFEGRNPIGMRISSDEGAHWRVVGVARNARTQTLRDAVRPRYFVPAFQQAALTSPMFFIRAETELPRIAQAARAAVQRVNPNLPITSSRSLNERMMPAIARDRMTAQLATVFAITALVLAAIGLYGVLSYGTTRRSGEIAIRIALGAQPTRVVAMILRETLGLVGVGLAIGGGLAYVSSQMIASELFGVAPQDVYTTALATALLLGVAFTATYVPARRASRVNPMVALHQG